MTVPEQHLVGLSRGPLVTLTRDQLFFHFNTLFYCNGQVLNNLRAMNRDNFCKNRGEKRANKNDPTDNNKLTVKIKKENEEDDEAPCISGIFDAIAFKDDIEDELSFEQLAATGSNDVKVLVKLVTGMAAEIKRLSAEVHEIRAILDGKLSGATAITTGQNFQSKYFLDLPLKTLEEFDGFDNRIKESDEFRNDFAQSLLVLFDREERLSRILTNILRRYLSRELAMKFTATKQSATKLVFKETNFCSCMLDVLVQLYEKDPRKSPMTEKKFYQTLSSIFPNAKDWDGCRSLRRKAAATGFGDDEYEDERD